ncbi:hypothetical protein ILUMI_26271 [Ignelater luminosus]|uniref:Uncharacterized protein n=1 Tax=Ignelater luminosus TaxID=2038154 RepID=A0A8K0C6U0_IGNLU|nr:hypothetical protein ILUMI_26271 [Ignelater luminosus]
MGCLQKLRDQMSLIEEEMLYPLYNDDLEFEEASDEESVDNIPEDELVDDEVLAGDNEEAEHATKMSTVVPYYVDKHEMLGPDGRM